MYIDAHCHLNDDALYPDYDTHAANFVKAWGVGIVTVWCDLDSSTRACEIAKNLVVGRSLWDSRFASLEQAKATIGIHPSEACFGAVTMDNIDSVLAGVEALYQHEKDVVCAIGECGIDMHYEWSVAALDVQQALFRRQCAWAREEKLPVVVHSRDGFEETVAVMKLYSDAVYYIHCFGYGPDEIKKLLEDFPKIYFGFDGNISYPKAQALRDACVLVPSDRLILETDAPYLAPQWLRGTTNVPANVQQIYAYVANLRGVDESMMCKEIAANAATLYAW